MRAATTAVPKPTTQIVDDKTTILDMVKWNSKLLNSSPAAENFTVLGEAINLDDARLGICCMPSGPKTKLSAGNAASDPANQQDPGAIKLGKEAVLNVLTNTADKYSLGGTPAGQAITDAYGWVSAPGNRLTTAELGTIMKRVNDAVIAQQPAAKPDFSAPRLAKRMPMECMAHLGREIQRATTANAQGPHTAFLQNLGEETQLRVMQHNLKFDDTKSWLNGVETGCRNEGLSELEKLAKELSASIPEQASAANYHTRLHDNVYGRALESKLIGELVRNPPESVKTAMREMALNLNETITSLPMQSQLQMAADVQGWLRADPRAWKTPNLQDFSAAPTAHDALASLQRLLNAPMADGLDCIAIPYLTVKTSLKAPNVPWMPLANANYSDVVHPATARIVPGQGHPNMPPPPPNPNREAAKAGITTHHQPSIETTGHSSMHPSDVNRPNLAEPSVALTQALENGLPYASGVSGSTNIAMHMVDYMQCMNKSIDAKDALLGIMMFLTYDGGHSMHEALWVAHQLSCETGRLPMTVPAPRDPVAFEAKRQEFLGKLQSAAGADVSPNISEQKKKSAKEWAGWLAIDQGANPAWPTNALAGRLAKELAENNFVADRAGFTKLLQDNIDPAHGMPAHDIAQKVDMLIGHLAIELTKKKERDDFIGDYQSFLGSFTPTGNEPALTEVAKNAWNDTLNHFAQHSYFSSENPARNQP